MNIKHFTLKIMDYEQKYKEALERAYVIYTTWKNKPDVAAVIKQALEKIFPELEETVNERIRKALIRNFTNQHSSNFPTTDGFTREQILAWLEKHGEKQIEPKFSVGDKIRLKGSCECYTVKSILNGVYRMESKEGNPALSRVSKQDDWELIGWNEEDEKMFLETMHDYDAVEDEWAVERVSAREWLESIKQRLKK